MKHRTPSILCPLAMLLVLVLTAPSFAETNRLGLYAILADSNNGACAPDQFSFRRYEIFLSSTPEVTSHLLISDIRCSGGSEVGTFESGAEVTGLSFVEDTVATANGAVTVERASGTFTVFNQVGAAPCPVRRIVVTGC